ncbi:hypothetical protein D3C80_164430 [compost metagenome]
MAHYKNLRRANLKTTRTCVSDPGYPRSASPFAESLIDHMSAGRDFQGFIVRQEAVAVTSAH